MGVRFGVTRRERWLWVSNGLLSFCASYAVVYWTEQYIPSGMASVLFATFPLFVAILAHMVIPGEPLTPRALAGVVVGFGGVAVIYSEDFSHFGGPMAATAAAVMLISPFVSAISNVLIKRWGAGVHPFSLAAIPMALAAGVMGAVAAAVEGWAGLSAAPRAWAALLYLAVFGSALTFTLYYWLMAHLPATRVSLIAYLVSHPCSSVNVITNVRENESRLIVCPSMCVMSGFARKATKSGHSVANGMVLFKVSNGQLSKPKFVIEELDLRTKENYEYRR